MSKIPEPPKIETLKDVLFYLLEYGDHIYVRNPKYSVNLVRLSSLRNEDWAEQVAKWIEKNQLPAYTEDDSEEDATDIQQGSCLCSSRGGCDSGGC